MKKIIVANWKMCGTPESSKLWVEEFIPAFSSSKFDSTVIICPPSPLLPMLQGEFAGSGIELGGQDCHFQPEGAYTGETSARLLKLVGCKYVIVGHSERRDYCKESNDIVKKKASMAISAGLIPIICIGETREQRESGKTIEIINRQLEESIPAEAVAGNFILAYEPVWAIGSGNLPTMNEIKQVHNAILTNVSRSLGVDIAGVAVLYGGSVKADNAREILALPEVAGVLVGGASLKAGEFLKIASGGQ